MNDTFKRSQDAIVERARARMTGDMFGFEWHEYVFRLDREHFKEFAKPDADLSDHEPASSDRVSLLAMMQEYMNFAWEKANNARGISANRSVMHYIAWTWLAGDDVLCAAIDEEFSRNYCHYGKPILAMICEFYGWDWRALDDGKWRDDDYGDGYPPDESLIRKVERTTEAEA